MEDAVTIEPEVEQQEPQQNGDPQDPPSKKLWQSLNTQKLYTKSYDDFVKQFSTPESIQKLHQSLSDQQLYTKSADDFTQQFFPPEVKKKEPTDVYSMASRIFSNSSSPLPSKSTDDPSHPLNFKVDGDGLFSDLYKDDPIGQVRASNELRNKKTTDAASAELGGDYEVPDQDAQIMADKMDADLTAKGYNVKQFKSLFADIPEKWFDTPGFTKDELVKRYQESPLNTERYVAALKWQQPIIEVLNDAQKKDPNTDYTPFINTVRNSATDVNYADKRTDNKALVEMANRIPDDDTREKVLHNLAVDRQFSYGQQANNPDIINGNPAFNQYQNAAYDYYKDLHPKEASQFDLALVDPNKIKDNPNAQVGLQEQQQKLEEVGINLAINHAKENIETLTPKFNELMAKKEKGTLTPDEEAQAAEIGLKIGKSQTDIAKATDAYNSFNQKYPATSALNTQEFAQELIGQVHDLGHPFMTLGNAVDNTYAGVANFAKQPFQSEEESRINQLEVLGQEKQQNNQAYLTQDNQLNQTFEPKLSPALQTQVDAIKNNKLMSFGEKLRATNQLLKDSPGQWSRQPIEGGKTNIGLASMLYGVGDLAANLAPFMALETLTGGGATAGATRKFASAFAATAATSYQETLANAIEKGVENPYAYAFRNTVINSLAMASAATPDAIRALASTQKGAVKDLISTMTDAEISAAVKEGSKTFNTFQKVYNVGKNVVKGTGEGLKSGAKINTFTTGGQIINDAISGDLKAPQDYAKQALLETLKFGVFGGILGAGKRTERPSETTAATILEAAKNPDAFTNALNERVQNGTISPKDAEQIKTNIDKSVKIVKDNPQINNLSDDAKREFVLNAITQNDAKEQMKSANPNQAEKLEHQSLVAKEKNALITEPKTDKQLEKRKAQLEKSITPVTDENGKETTLPDNELKQAKAELEAINFVQEERKKANEQPATTTDNGEPKDTNLPIEKNTGESKTEETTNPTVQQDIIGDGQGREETGTAVLDDREKNADVMREILQDTSTSKDANQLLLEERGNIGDAITDYEEGKIDGAVLKKVFIDNNVPEEYISRKLEEAGMTHDLSLPENISSPKSTEDGKGNNAETKTERRQNVLSTSEEKTTTVPDNKGAVVTETKDNEKSTEIPVTKTGESINNEPPDKISGTAETGEEGEKVGVHHAALTELADKLGLQKPEAGEYLTPEEHADRGRALMKAGADVSELDNKANDLHDRISIGRAHLEKLVKELNGIRKEKGIDSPEYKGKLADVDNLRKKVKELGSAAGQAFTSLQGERNIDTDNFEAVKHATEDLQDKPLTPAQLKKAQELTDKNEALRIRAEEAEAKLIEETQKAFDEGYEKGKKDGKPGKSVRDKSKNIAARIREAKVHRPGSFSAATPASLIWDSAVEVVAKSIEAGGAIADAVQKGIAHIRESDWYKGLTEDKQEQAENDFYDFHNEQTGLTDLQKMFMDKKQNDLKFTPEEGREVWDYGKDVYLNHGASFRDMIRNVANDTGLSYRQVAEAISTKKTKEVSDEMWAAQSELKKGRKATQDWVEQQGKNKNPIVRGFKTVMGVFRGISVFGHGAIFVGTHAGATLFDPKLSRSTQRAFLNGWKFAYGKTRNYELAMEQFKDRPNYLMAQRAGLKNNPERINVEEYQRSQDFLRKIGLGKVATAGERGFNAIKVLRQDIFDHEYSRLSEEEKNDPNSVKRLAELVNNATGATNLKVPEVINEATFAGGMEASRWGRLITNPLKATATALETIKGMITGKKTVTPSEAVFAKTWAKRAGRQIAVYAGALAANAALQKVINPKNPVNLTNPNEPDFLKFKFGSSTIDPTSGVRSSAAFIYGIVKIPFESKKDLRGDTRGQAFSKSVGGYARGKLAPGYGTLVDLFTGQDFNGNNLPFNNDKLTSGKHKLTPAEYLWSKAPLPAAEAASVYYKAAMENGNESTTKLVLQGVLTGALSGSTGFRVGESTEKKEPFTPEDKKDPTFKFYLDKGLDLPNTVHTSEEITDEKNGTKKKLSDYPKDVQDKYDELHKQNLKTELSKLKGIVFIKTYKDAQNNDVVEVYKEKPKGNAIRKNINDLSKDELEQVLKNAQSKATTATKKKIFGG